MGAEEDELDSQASDNGGAAELAQPSVGQARKKKAVVKAVAVKVASKQTKNKKRGTRKNPESSSEDGEAQESRRRSGRVPAATQTAVQAAKRRLVDGDTIYAPLHDGVYWPAVVSRPLLFPFERRRAGG